MNSLGDFKSAFLTIEDRSPVVVAHLTKQRLTEEENIEQLGQDFSILVEHYGCRKLVVDLEVVNLATSSALGKLISLHRNLHRRDGSLVLCGVKGMLLDVLHTANLIDYFGVADSVEEAVARLGEAPGETA
jgi:anti-sigma B factor antagonist